MDKFVIPILRTFLFLKRKRFFAHEVANKLFIFIGLFAVVMSIIGVVTIVTQKYVSQFVVVNQNTTIATSVILAMLLYNPIKNMLIHVTDRFLFQKQLNHQNFLRIASEAISQVSTLDELSRRIAYIFSLMVRIKNVSVFTKDWIYKGTFILKARRGAHSAILPYRISLDDPILRMISETKQPIQLENIEDQILAKKGKPEERKFIEIKNRMKELNANVVVPSFVGEENNAKDFGLVSLLFLGEKRSDYEYSEKDINIFFTLAHQVAIAIENATLFDKAIFQRHQYEEVNTELETANEGLKRTQNRLVVAEKRTILDGMAKALGHEINNPLAGLQARAENIHKEDMESLKAIYENSIKNKFPEDIKQSFEEKMNSIEDKSRRVFRSGKRIEVAVRTLTHLQQEGTEHLGPLNFRILWKECLEARLFLVDKDSLQKDCKFEDHIAPNLIIIGNIDQLIQVFTNMIKNSYEAFGDNLEKEIIINANVDPDNPRFARIEYSDNGMGISKDIQEKIWQQDFTTKALGQEDAPGKGQGLYISKQIVEVIHHGKIWLENSTDKGSVFVLQVPLGES